MRENKTETLNKIVSLRTLAIIMVVFGHSIILYSDKWNLYSTVYHVPVLNAVKEWINLIQMPLFLSISGFLFARSHNKYSFVIFIKKKIKRLLVPYLVFALAWMYPIKWLVGYYAQDKNIISFIVRDVLLGHDIGHLWFLPCLFLCFACSFFLFRLFRTKSKAERILKWVLFFVLYLVSVVGSRFGRIPWMYYLCSNFVWFYAGGLIYDYSEEIERQNSILISVIGIAGSVFAVWCDIWFVKGIATVLLLLMLYNIVAESKSRIIQSINDCSFGIYLLHSPLIYITFSFAANYNPVFVVFANMMFAVVSWLLTALCMKTKLKFIFGG